MSRFNTGNPIGSADPRDRDDNSKNLDEAVNDLNSETWIDRFGVERTTISRVEGLAEAAAAIVAGSEDVTLAYQAAIQNEMAFRIPESAIGYTASLADGGPENRAPFEYSSRVIGASGLTFLLDAPSLVARRAMINLPVNSDRAIEVSLLTGLNAENQLLANGVCNIAVAWYSSSRERLVGTPETVVLETTDPLNTASYSYSFTIGNENNDSDVVPPDGAIYCIPYFEFTGTGFQFFASLLSVLDVTQRKQIEQLQQYGYSALLSVLNDDTEANIFDFTNQALGSSKPRLGGAFPSHKAFVGDAVFSGDAETVLSHGKLMPGQLDSTAGRLVYAANKPLIPESGDFTFFGSTFMNGSQTGNRTLVWQNVNGEVGRLQCILNGGFVGSTQGTINEVVGIWAAGIEDGSGLGDYPEKGAAVRGKPVSFVVTMREGVGASEFWLNGRLIDTFTRPATIAQFNTSIMGTGGQAEQPGRNYARFGVINKAANADEIAVIGQWCADAYDDKWDRDFLEGREAMPNALGGVSLSLSQGSSPQKLDNYSQMRELYLASYQQILYPASMTKVITSMVLLDNITDMNATIEMIEGDQTGGSGNNLDPGDVITVSDAIYNMMLPSSNVTTTVVARTVGVMLLDGNPGDPIDRFIEEMNSKALQLGMYNSNFTNASGLANTEMVTTPEDMARLCSNVPNYADLFSRWGAVDHTLNITGANPRTVEITHSAAQVMVEDAYQGGKTGTVTSSPLGSTTRNFMWIGKAPNGNYTANVVMLVVGEDRYEDANGLQNHVFTNLRWPINI